LSLPIPLIRQHAIGYGPANLITDRDGIVRSGRLAIPFQDRRFPGLAYRIYEAMSGKKKPQDNEVSTAPYIINFRGPARSYPVVPYYRILRGEIEPAVFRDKTVLVGAYSPSLHDLFPTLQQRAPQRGFRRISETLAAGDPIVSIPGWVTAALFLVLSALSIWASIHLRPMSATAVVLALIVLYGFAALYALSFHHLWVAVVSTMSASTLSYGGIILDHTPGAKSGWHPRDVNTRVGRCRRGDPRIGKASSERSARISPCCSPIFAALPASRNRSAPSKWSRC
jgi:CHASE2 domain-containing sensor protein